MFKFPNGIVAGSWGLVPFHSFYAYPDVSSGDHADVVGAVPNGQRDAVGFGLSYSWNDLLFLARTDPATNDWVNLVSELEE